MRWSSNSPITSTSHFLSGTTTTAAPRRPRRTTNSGLAPRSAGPSSGERRKRRVPARVQGEILMNTSAAFVKETIFKGLLFLIPVALVVVIFSKVIELLSKLAHPLVQNLGI